MSENQQDEVGYEESESETQIIYNHALKHLVGISILTDAPWPGAKQYDGTNKRRIILSATVFEYSGKWVLATAGHVVRGLEEAVRGGYELQVKLIDHWAKKDSTKTMIPIYFAPDTAFYIDLDELDFGFIGISDNTRSLLEAYGIRAIGPEHWSHTPDDDKYQICALIGIPSKTLEIVRKDRISISICVKPELIGLEHKFVIPQNVGNKEACLWYGRADRDKIPIDHHDIDGMSGGAVFGLYRNDDGSIGYHMIGLQRGVIRESHYLYFLVTPYKAIASLMDHYKRNHLQENTSQASE